MPRFPEYLDDEEAALYATAAQSGENDPWKLATNEMRWVQCQPHLLSRGYQLRPRYRPGWIRSWKGTNRNPLVCEDALTLESFKIMDATRVTDGKQVILKAFDTSATPEELPILQYLGVDRLRSNPRNHCAYASDSFPIPIPGRETWTFVVMDTYSPIDLVPFETIGEVVELVYQLLEGLTFMHEINIAHRDCALANIMMKADSLFGSVPHPHPDYMYLTEDGTERVKLYNRTGRDVKYYFIDFGLSVQFPSYAERELVTGAEGREREVPELLTPDVPYDPFKVDVCILGQSLWKGFYLNSTRSLYFMEPLLKSMIASKPSDRPTAAEALAEFERIRGQLSSRTLSRVLNPGAFRRMLYFIFDSFTLAERWLKQHISGSRSRGIMLP